MPRDAVSRTANVGTVGMNGLISHDRTKPIARRAEGTGAASQFTRNILPQQNRSFRTNLFFISLVKSNQIEDRISVGGKILLKKG